MESQLDAWQQEYQSRYNQMVACDYSDESRAIFLNLLEEQCKRQPESWFIASEVVCLNLANQVLDPLTKFHFWVAALKFAIRAVEVDEKWPSSISEYATEACNYLFYASNAHDGDIDDPVDSDESLDSEEESKFKALAKDLYELLLTRVGTADGFWMLELAHHLNGGFDLEQIAEAKLHPQLGKSFDQLLDEAADKPNAPNYIHYICHNRRLAGIVTPMPDDHLYSHLFWCRQFAAMKLAPYKTLFEKLAKEPESKFTNAMLTFYGLTTSMMGLTMIVYFGLEEPFPDFEEFLQDLFKGVPLSHLKALKLDGQPLEEAKRSVRFLIETRLPIPKPVLTKNIY